MVDPSYSRVVWAMVAYVVWLGSAMYIVGQLDLAVGVLRRAVDRELTRVRSGRSGKAAGSPRSSFFPRVLRLRRRPAG